MPFPCKNPTITYSGKSYTMDEFRDVLKKLPPSEISKHIEGISSIPAMPFEKTWHELALRRMLRWAAENDFDRVAWTSGEQQAARYDLSKTFKNVFWVKRGKEIEIGADPLKGDRSQGLGSFLPEKLDDVVGKDLAERIRADLSNGKTQENYSGVDLKVGGEGMKAFYDRMLPQYLDKYGKRWGAKVEPVEINTGIDEKFAQESRRAGYSENYINEKKQTEAVQSIPVTLAMRRSVLEEGQPLFQKPATGPKGSFQQKGDKSIITLFKGNADITTWLHEQAHFLRRTALGEGQSESVLRWAGQKEWNREAEEKFARAFERYFYDGKSPRKDLNEPMSRLKDSFRKTYKELPDEIKDDLTPEMRLVFDNLLLRNKTADPMRVRNLLRAIPKAQGVVAARLTDRLRAEFDGERD